MVAIQLTPGQAVSLHSWSNPRLSLQWSDIVENDKLTFAKCRECNVPLKSLHMLQGDVREWKRHGAVTLAHLPEMQHLWNAHPIRDMYADLSDLLQVRWSADTMKRLGVSMAQLHEIGLTADNMALFGYTLMGWVGLGFTADDAARMTDVQIARNFGLTRQAVLQVLSDTPTAAAVVASVVHTPR